MSLQFNDTSTYKGLVQVYEKEIGASRGFVSGDTGRLKDFAVDVNLALDDYLHLAFHAGGTWQFDDSGHSGFPEVTANIVSGTHRYAFTVDASTNLILDVYKVLILPSASATVYEEIAPVDAQGDDGLVLRTGDATTGVPTVYDKTGKWVDLWPTPNYNATNGIKILINREGSYFASTDTTKKPGCPGNHHRYFAIKPALDYARRNGLANFSALQLEVMRLEDLIMKDFSKRDRDVREYATPEEIIYE